MLLPTKHENLKKNMLVLGADIIRFLKRNGESPVEIVFQYLKLDKLVLTIISTRLYIFG